MDLKRLGILDRAAGLGLPKTRKEKQYLSGYDETHRHLY